jgi:hypothetical protein
VDPRATLNFLGSLSLDTCSAIRSVVLADELLTSSTSSPVCINDLDWSRPDQLGGVSSEEPTSFLSFLRSYLPNLGEVAIFVPITLEREDFFYDPCALVRICEMLEDGTIDILRLMYADALPAPFNLCDCRFASRLIRPQPKQTFEENMYRMQMGEPIVPNKFPDKFAATREDKIPECGEGEAACGWTKAKAVFALRRYAPGATRLRECRPIISKEA